MENNNLDCQPMEGCVQSGSNLLANTVAHDILYSVFINQLDDILDGKQNSTFMHADEFQEKKFHSILSKVSALMQVDMKANAYRQMLINAKNYWKNAISNIKSDEKERLAEATNSYNTYAAVLTQYEDIMGIEHSDEDTEAEAIES